MEMQADLLDLRAGQAGHLLQIAFCIPDGSIHCLERCLELLYLQTILSIAYNS